MFLELSTYFHILLYYSMFMWHCQGKKAFFELDFFDINTKIML